MTLDDVLALDPCADARKWLSTQSDARTAWETCPRGDWLLWLCVRRLPRRRAVGLCADVASTVLHLADGCAPVAACLETCWAYARGEVSEDALPGAYAGADSVAASAAAALARAYVPASAAFYAAAIAAGCAVITAPAAATYAASACAEIAPDGDDAPAYDEALKDIADLVRSRVTFEALAEGGR